MTLYPEPNSANYFLPFLIRSYKGNEGLCELGVNFRLYYKSFGSH